MGIVKPPEPALLFAAVFSHEAGQHAEAIGRMASSWGTPCLTAGPFPFDHTDYYSGEMGEGLSKTFFLFDRPFDPGDVAGVKLASNAAEKETASDGRRQVNIDPGYITLSKVVLATTKNYSHRIYAGQGIYCEITLQWFKGAFRPCEWTYPDYRDPEVISFFNRCRTCLKNGGHADSKKSNTLAE